MSEKEFELILNKFEKLGEHLSEKALEGADFMFPLVIKNQLIEGIICLLATIVIGVIIGLVLRFMEGNNQIGDEERAAMGVLTILLFLLEFPFLYFAVSHLLNPKYQAILEIVSKLE